MKFILIFLFLPFLLFASTDRALYIKKHKNESKTALVIGNSNYSHFSKLKNSINDAKDMKTLLQSLGFKVHYLENATLRDMKKTLRNFSVDIKSGGVGMVYYAGHGIEVEGKNYLLPIDADIPDKDEVEFSSFPVDLFIKKMENAKNRLNILVLDACRNDPFSRSGSGGLAAINNAKGMYVAYATAPGDVASDGDGINGLFTKHLIKNIQIPNLKLNEVFANTRRDVYNESNQKQLPWSSSSVIGEFFFSIDDDLIFQKSSKTVSKEEKEFWEVVVKKNDKNSYKLYIKEFPAGFYYFQAKDALYKIKLKEKQKELLNLNRKKRVIVLPLNINYNGVIQCNQKAIAAVDKSLDDNIFEKYANFCDEKNGKVKFPKINPDYPIWDSKGLFSSVEPHIANIKLNTQSLDANIAVTFRADGKYNNITYFEAYVIDLKKNKIYKKEARVITVDDIPLIIRGLLDEYLKEKK